MQGINSVETNEPQRRRRSGIITPQTPTDHFKRGFLPPVAMTTAQDRGQTQFPICCTLIKLVCKVAVRQSYPLPKPCVQVTTRAGIRATETTGARATETRATAVIVDTTTMTTPLVTMDMGLDMITVSQDECVCCRSVLLRVSIHVIFCCAV